MSMIRRIMKQPFKELLLLGFLGSFTAATAETPDSSLPAPNSLSSYDFNEAYMEGIRERLREVESAPISVLRKNGSQFEGHLDHFSEDGFSLFRQVSGSGEVIVTYRWEEVYVLGFEGNELWEEVKALEASEQWVLLIEIMEPLFRQRSPFFPVIPENDVFRFHLLVESYLKVGSPTPALGLVRNLMPWIETPERVSRMENTTLAVYLSNRLNVEAVALARQIIASTTDVSAVSLAWVALGIDHLNEGRYREAWLSVIHPILFDRGRASGHVADAYMIAQIATLKMNRPQLAFAYRRDAEESMIEIVEQPFHQEWFGWWREVDWEALKSHTTEMERFADIESTIREVKPIDHEAVPIIKIPILKK